MVLACRSCGDDLGVWPLLHLGVTISNNLKHLGTLCCGRSEDLFVQEGVIGLQRFKVIGCPKGAFTAVKPGELHSQDPAQWSLTFPRLSKKPQSVITQMWDNDFEQATHLRIDIGDGQVISLTQLCNSRLVGRRV